METQRLQINGITAVLRYRDQFIFEVSKPHYWAADEKGRTLIGIKCIGGAPEGQESLMEALRREFQEEISTDARLVQGLSPFLMNLNMTVSDPAPEHYAVRNAYFVWEYQRPSQQGAICTYIG